MCCFSMAVKALILSFILWVMIVFPTAKVNVGLRVTGVCSDGFHTVESILYPFPLYDVLEFRQAESFRLELFGKPVPGKLSDNLVHRAWWLMHRRYSVPPVEVLLLKNIPPGSGLGGGSSDAAFFLKGLCEYFHLNPAPEALFEMALSLGSDVPFFLGNRPALVSGRGEILSPVDLDLSPYRMILVVPPVHLSTKEMYANVKCKKPEKPLEGLVRLPVGQWGSKVINDFEALAFARWPVLAEIKQSLLEAGALFASLTGTGSALFALFDKKPGTNAFSRYGEVYGC